MRVARLAVTLFSVSGLALMAAGTGTAAAAAPVADPLSSAAAAERVSAVLMLDSADGSSRRALAHLSTAPAPRAPAGLAERRAELRSVTPPGSAERAVTDYAHRNGLRVDSSSRWQVVVSGPAASTSSLFGTRAVPASAATVAPAARGPVPRGGYVRPRSAPQVPTALGVHVSQVLGLDNRPIFTHHAAVSGANMRAAYQSPSPGTGAGITVGTVQLSDYDPHDFTVFARANGMPDPVANGQVSRVQVSQPTDTMRSPGAAEVALDTEAILSVAPKAKQRIYVANNDLAGSAAVYDRIAADAASGLIQVVSTSWGTCEDLMAEAYPSALRSAHAAIGRTVSAGATVFAASGDDGSQDCPAFFSDSDDVDYPASDPAVVAVGGTTLRHSSKGWSESAWDGSGGGVSDRFGRPAYQAHTGISGRGRQVPDISSNADPATGFHTYTAAARGWFYGGGTSLAAPSQAAMLAITLSANGRRTGAGDIHPFIYENPGGQFRDITSGTNGSYSAKRGYDLVTGLGSPLWAKLRYRLVAPPAPPRVAATGGYRSITGSWPVSSRATGYQVSTLPTTSTRSVGAGTRSVTFSGLKPGVSYRVQVRSRNSFGSSAVRTSGYATPSRTVVAGIGTDHHLYARSTTGGWRNLGGRSFSAPAVIAWNNQAYYLTVATNRQLYVRTEGSGWARLAAGSTTCTSLGATVTGSTLTVVCRGPRGALYRAATTLRSVGLPRLSSWSGLGGQTSAPPAVATFGGATTYFAVARGGVLYSRTAGTGWRSHHVRCPSGPALQASGRSVTLACRGADSRMYVATSSGTPFHGAHSVGGTIHGLAAVASPPAPLIFGAGSYGQVWMRSGGRWLNLGGRVVGGVSAAGDAT